MKLNVLCRRKFLFASMRGDGMLSLHNWIFNSLYVTERHSVVSQVRSLKFISKSKYWSTNVQKEIHLHELYTLL